NDLYASGFVLVDAGKRAGVTSWTFTWTAPPSGSGPVTFYVALVDGNGAGSAPGVTLTDPFGDDVVAGAITIDEASAAMIPRYLRHATAKRAPAPPASRSGDDTVPFLPHSSITTSNEPTNETNDRRGNCRRDTKCTSISPEASVSARHLNSQPRKLLRVSSSSREKIVAGEAPKRRSVPSMSGRRSGTISLLASCDSWRTASSPCSSSTAAISSSIGSPSIHELDGGGASSSARVGSPTRALTASSQPLRARSFTYARSAAPLT